MAGQGIRRRRNRRLPPKQVSASIFDALEKLGLTDQVRRLRIQQAWNRAVGPEVAARTQPQSFNRGVLVVKSGSAAWQNELTFLKKEIIEKVNEALGRKTVRELRVVSGHVEPPNAPAPPPLPWVDEKPSDEDLAVADDLEQPIADPEVREAFRRMLLVDRRYRRRGEK